MQAVARLGNGRSVQLIDGLLGSYEPSPRRCAAAAMCLAADSTLSAQIPILGL
jgi:hypothetical protein